MNVLLLHTKVKYRYLQKLTKRTVQMQTDTWFVVCEISKEFNNYFSQILLTISLTSGITLLNIAPKDNIENEQSLSKARNAA